MIDPNPVATPFPPLNLSQTGKQWPVTAPTATNDWRASKSIKFLINRNLKNKLVINIAKAPFPPSRISVSRAIFLLPVLKTFVAPIFPLPIFLISPSPDNLVKINPNGIDPIKYPKRNSAVSYTHLTLPTTPYV